MFSPYEQQRQHPSPESAVGSQHSLDGSHIAAPPQTPQAGAAYAVMDDDLTFHGFATVTGVEFPPIEDHSQTSHSQDGLGSPLWMPAVFEDNYSLEPTSVSPEFSGVLSSATDTAAPRHIWEMTAQEIHGMHEEQSKFASPADHTMSSASSDRYDDASSAFYPGLSYQSPYLPSQAHGAESYQTNAASSPLSVAYSPMSAATTLVDHYAGHSPQGHHHHYGDAADLVDSRLLSPLKGNSEVTASVAVACHTPSSNNTANANKAEEPYAKILYRALMSQPDHQMALRDIYRWFVTNTDKAKNGTTGWQNSIRHNLSMNQAFSRIETDDPGAGRSKKSAYWRLADWAVDGVESTTRYRAKGAGRLHAGMGSPSSSASTARYMKAVKAANGRKGGAAASRAKRMHQLEQQQQQQMQMDAHAMHLHHQHQHQQQQQYQYQQHPGYAYPRTIENTYAHHPNAGAYYAHHNPHHPHHPFHPHHPHDHVMNGINYDLSGLHDPFSTKSVEDQQQRQQQRQVLSPPTPPVEYALPPMAVATVAHHDQYDDGDGHDDSSGDGGYPAGQVAPPQQQPIEEFLGSPRHEL